MMSELLNTEWICFEITSNMSSFPTERKFSLNLKVIELKSKLVLITGASIESMKIQLYSNESLIAELDDNEQQLKNCLNDNQLSNKLRIHVMDNNAVQLDDLSSVPKFELSKEEYEKRNESVLAFKMKNKLGRFGSSGDTSDDNQQMRPDIKVGLRCQVCVKSNPRRRATVMFYGWTQFKAGLWVGVRYDEPLGKNDGSFDGIRYFECQPKYGGFVRHNDVIIGDFPEEGMDFE